MFLDSLEHLGYHPNIGHKEAVKLDILQTIEILSDIHS